MEFLKSETKNNLARAFAGECQDGARYQFMAKSALKQELSALADQFKTFAKHEMAHAKVFYDLLLSSAKEELSNIEICAGYPFEDYDIETSIKNMAGIELSESRNIYPAFAKVARDEGFPEIADAFELAALVENKHFLALNDIAEKYASKKLYSSAEATMWKCSSCGHEHEAKSAWKQCPLCQMPQGYAELKLTDE